MLCCCIAKLQSVATLLHSVLLLATHAHAAIWLLKSHIQWSYALDCHGATAQEKGRSESCTAAVGLCWTPDALAHVLLKDKSCYKRRVYVIIASKSLQCTCYGCVACLQVAYTRNIREFEWSFRSRWHWIIKRETNSAYSRVVLRVACVFAGMSKFHCMLFDCLQYV